MKSDVKITGNHLQITRVFDAPRERVFAAWKTREMLQRWSGCKETTRNDIELDFRVGGSFTHNSGTSRRETDDARPAFCDGECRVSQRSLDSPDQAAANRAGILSCIFLSWRGLGEGEGGSTDHGCMRCEHRYCRQG